ncbi:uncharacterized protein TNCV_2420301 [Trichonephila clavipes]|nr:uncharacterized protein TNCV_2420301 [Trichonephila clavipes]
MFGMSERKLLRKKKNKKTENENKNEKNQESSSKNSSESLSETKRQVQVRRIEEFLCDEDPDIIGIQETHLGPADSFKLPNYICHRSDRLSHRGGGTAIFVRNSLRHHVVSFNTSTFENTTVRIELGNNTHLTLSCIYKPPRNHINTSELDAILNASPKVMLLVILMLTTHVGTQGAQTLMETLFTTGRAPMP